MLRKEFKKYEVVKKCDLCGSKNIKEYFRPGDIVKCVDCNFLFVSPRPSLDDIRNSYSDKGFYDSWLLESEGRLKMWQKRYNRIKKYLNSFSNILDYSAGIGTFLRLAKNDGHNAFGTELSASAKKIAANQYGLKLFDTEYFFGSKYHNYFDVITAWHVVEHVVSPKALAKHFLKILRPGGWLFVAVPNAHKKMLRKVFFKQNMEHNFPKLKAGDEIHLSHFNDDTIVKMLESVGFSITHVGIDDHYPIFTYKNRIKHLCFKIIYSITNNNYSPTIFVVAKK